jgi:predicted transcriptional regulator
MVRLIPYLLALAVGFILGKMLFSGRPPAPEDESLRQKHAELSARYHDLYRKLKGNRLEDDPANRLRRTLWDVRGLLGDPQKITSERAESALREIDSALREIQDPGPQKPS